MWLSEHRGLVEGSPSTGLPARLRKPLPGNTCPRSPIPLSQKLRGRCAAVSWVPLPLLGPSPWSSTVTADDHNQPVRAYVPRSPLFKIHSRVHVGPGQGWLWGFPSHLGPFSLSGKPCPQLSRLVSGWPPFAQLMFLKSCSSETLCSGLQQKAFGAESF